MPGGHRALVAVGPGGRSVAVALNQVPDSLRAEPDFQHLLGTSLRDGEKTWAAARDTTYGLGRRRDAVPAVVDRVQAAAGRAPLRVGGYRVDDGVAPMVVFSGLSQDDDAAYGDLAAAVRDLRDAADGKAVEPSPWPADALGFMLTGSESAYGSVQMAILCGDVAAPHDPETYWRGVRRVRAQDPLFGPVTNRIGPCAFWDPPRERPTTIRDDLPALLVNATGDPRTVYAGARAVHRGWPGSRLVTLRGADQHAVFGVYGSARADAAVNAYLAGGRLPATDVSCAARPVPAP